MAIVATAVKNIAAYPTLLRMRTISGTLRGNTTIWRKKDRMESFKHSSNMGIPPIIHLIDNKPHLSIKTSKQNPDLKYHACSQHKHTQRKHTHVTHITPGMHSSTHREDIITYIY